MHASEDLMRDARVAAKSMPFRRREEIEQLIEEYATACALSVGPDKSRSRHWHGKARSLDGRLREIVGVNATKR